MNKLFRVLTAIGVGDPLGPNDQDPDTVREQACRLVSRDASVCSAPRPPPRGDSSGGGISLDWLASLLWLVFIGLLLAMLVLLVRFLFSRSGRARRKRKRFDPEADLDEVEQAAVMIDRTREPTNWRAEAEEHRRAGRFRDAVRCRYRALVGDLARRGLIDEIPGRTTGEERTQLHSVRPAAGVPFHIAADLFDGAWYGDVAVVADDDERFLALEREVLAETASDHGLRR
ncbi:MAG: DUF4129 domain-containing protein [Actinobacteria bacterium]|nr:DUF4129 domain-containing protein [Actinomycetota bacterium]